MTDFDVVIIGAGPGGYVAALRAAQLRLKTACVEKDKSLGGTCLNVGCIPSKALLDSSEHYAFTKQKLSRHGIVMKEVGLDIATMMKRKDQVVSQLTQGISGLFKKAGVEHILGQGRLLNSQTVEVKLTNGSIQKLTTKKIILATGSEPISLSTAPFDRQRIIGSTEALSLPQVPETMIVVGGGAIGLEMGSVWARLGTKVTVVEFQDRIVPSSDKQVGAELLKILTRQGLEFKLSTKVTRAQTEGKKVFVETDDASGKKEKTQTDYVLVAVGRKPYFESLGLKEMGITQDKAGHVQVNKNFETNISGIYAIGDLIRGPMLAHKAEEEGIAVAEIIAGKQGHVNYNAIPNVVYTWPELATVGLSEEECKEKRLDYRIGTFPFLANGRAKAMGESEGFVKIIADTKTDRVLGVHIVGPRASDMIAEAVAVMEFGGSAEDIARSSHAHPTLAEVMKEAALNVDKRQLHM